MVILKMMALVLSLGMDTLMMSISLGFAEVSGKVKVAMTFAAAEALMPLIGLAIGRGTGRLIGDWASLIGGMALLAVAAWLFFFEDEHEEDKLGRNLIGWTLVVTAFGISLDEIAVGFSIGLVGVPIALTIALIALQAFIFTLIGLSFGAKLKPLLGEWAEKLSGIILGFLGLWVLIDAVTHVVQI